MPNIVVKAEVVKADQIKRFTKKPQSVTAHLLHGGWQETLHITARGVFWGQIKQEFFSATILKMAANARRQAEGWGENEKHQEKRREKERVDDTPNEIYL